MKALNFIGINLLVIISVICISACSSDSIVPQITVDAEDNNYFLKNMEFEYSEGEKTFAFNSNVKWSITVSSVEDEETWCSVTPNSGSEGYNIVRVKVKENPNYNERSAILTLSAGSLNKTITIMQEKNMSQPTYTSYVTIVGDNTSGYTFYADFGSILKPKSNNIQEVMPGLSKTDVKRAFIAFDLASKTENGKNLEVGKTYDIIVRPSYYANYAIPTYNTIDIADNTAAADSLITQNGYISNFNQNIWAANGYMNVQLTISFNQNKAFYIKTYFDSEKDLDIKNNILYLNLYYNSHSTETNSQGTSVFSFDLPDETYNAFQKDNIKLVLKAKTKNSNNKLVEIGNCEIKKKDLFIPID